MRIARGIDQRCAFDRQYHPWRGAQHRRRQWLAQRWWLGRFDRRERDDHHRGRLGERDRRVEQYRDIALTLLRERRDELELRRLERAEHPEQVADDADIRTIRAIAGLRRRAQLESEIGRRARKCIGQRRTVRVGEQQRLAVAGEARRLDFGRLREAFGLELDRKAARQDRRDGGKALGVPALGTLHLEEEGVEPCAVERGLIELLRRADERTGLLADRADHRIRAAAALGDDEQRHLLCVLGDDERQAGVLLPPTLGLAEPVLTGAIDRAAQEHRDQPIMFVMPRKGGELDRDVIPFGEVGHALERERNAVAHHTDVQSGADKVERGGRRLDGGRRQQQTEKTDDRRKTQHGVHGSTSACRGLCRWRVATMRLKPRGRNPASSKLAVVCDEPRRPPDPAIPPASQSRLDRRGLTPGSPSSRGSRSLRGL